MSVFDPAVMVTAFLAGLLGSGHCFSMCGGIAAGLGAISPSGQFSDSRSMNYAPAFQFNLGRILSYALLGMLAGGVLGVVSDWITLGRWLRLLTALLILAVGLRFLFDWRGIEFIERGGAALWKRILPWAIRASHRHDWMGRLFLGLCWGFLPCGLVYTILLTAASTGKPLTGAVTMLSFGVGTMPAMLGLTLAAPALASMLQDKTVRRIIGFALVVLAAWTLFMMWNATQGGMHHMQH